MTQEVMDFLHIHWTGLVPKLLLICLVILFCSVLFLLCYFVKRLVTLELADADWGHLSWDGSRSH